jgi:hypothetical protein
MQTSCNPVFPGRQVQLTSTAKPVTPFGGLVSLVAFFDRIGLAGRISGQMPVVYTSLNAIPPAQTLVAFIVSLVAGARRLVVPSDSKPALTDRNWLRCSIFIMNRD